VGGLRSVGRMVTRQQLTTVGVAVVGATILGFLLRVDPGSTTFYLLTLLLAGVWTVGGFLAGPVHLGRVGPLLPARKEAPTSAAGITEPEPPPGVRPWLGPFVLGLALSALFVVGGLVVREIGPLADAVRGVLGYASDTPLVLIVAVTAINGVAEEIFFRGALYDAVPHHKEIVTTLVYAVATLATGNPMLAFAALLIGYVTAHQRRITGGILAPALTHITWSVSMLFILPALFGV